MPYSISDHVLISQVNTLWGNSLSKSTKQTYRTALQCFLTFMTMHGVRTTPSSLPAINEDHLIYFVSHCKQGLKLQFDIIKLYLAGIRFHYLRTGHNDPTARADRSSYILRGIKKSQHNITKTRLPVTSHILQQLCTLLQQGCFSPYVDLMLLCSFKMAFFGFLRCGEFTCKTIHDKQHCLLIKAVTFHNASNCYILNLKSSKVDPFQKGVNITINENQVFTPVETMQKYVNLRLHMGATANSPLFLDSDNSQSPLNRKRFLSYLNELLTRLGYRNDHFCDHSFRIGAATSAAAAGVEDHVIQTLGRWSSDCYIRYIQTDQRIVRMAQEKMCHC